MSSDDEQICSDFDGGGHIGFDPRREFVKLIRNYAPVDELRILFSSIVSVHDAPEDEPYLHVAAKACNLNAIRFLFARNCAFNSVDQYGFTALETCVLHSKVTPFMLLLNFPYRSLAAHKRIFVCALFLSLENRRFFMFRELVRTGIININAVYERGPIICCVPPSEPEYLKVLLDVGADVNVRDTSKLTPLMIACRDPDGYEAAKMIIDSGADVNAVSSERFLEDCRSVLHYAVLSNNLNTVKVCSLFFLYIFKTLICFFFHTFD